MATQFRSGTQGNNTGATSGQSIGLPAGMTSGDLIVIVGEVNDVDVTFSVPAGWTVEAEDWDGAFVGQNGFIVSGFWNGSDTTVTVTASASVAGWYWNVQAFYDDAAGAIAISDVAIANSAASAGATATCPAATGAGATDTVIRAVGLSFFNNSSFDSSAPAGYTDPSLATASNPGIRRGYFASYYDLSDNGNTTKNITSSGNNYWIAFTVAIEAVAGCAPPTTDVAPSISGTPEVGETLTLTQGTYSGDPTIVISDQWYRFCGTGPEEEIIGETGVTYEVTEDDLGCDLFVRETAASACPPDDVEDTSSLGPVTCGDPANTGLPTVTGVTPSGHTLEGSEGTWLCATSFDFQWYLDCGGGPVAIGGETTDEIETDDSMIGCTLLFGVIAHGPGGDSSEIFSAAFGPIQANVPAAVRFYQSPPWRFVVLDLDTFETLSFLDHIATDRSVNFVLNGPAVATMKVPSDEPEVNIPWPGANDEPFLAEGTRALLGFRREGVFPNGPWVIRYAGRIEQLEDIAESDNAFTHITAYDPLRYLMSRPVRNGPDFDYTLPGVDGSSYTQTRIDVIIGEIIHNTIVTDGPVGIDLGVTYGGTAFWGGSITPCDQIDINFAQGTTVGEAIQQLTNTDQCDVLMIPIYDPLNRPGYLVDMTIAPQVGTTKNDAIFAWDRPSHSLIGISRLKDGTTRANNVKFFAGQGGTATGGQTIPVKVDAASDAKYGDYWYQQFWPGQNVAGAVELLAETALEIRKNGRTTVTISPAPQRSPIPFQEYYLGDRVPVYASRRFREPIPEGGVEGIEYQRIYGMPIAIADDESETLISILTSVAT